MSAPSEREMRKAQAEFKETAMREKGLALMYELMERFPDEAIRYQGHLARRRITGNARTA